MEKSFVEIRKRFEKMHSKLNKCSTFAKCKTINATTLIHSGFQSCTQIAKQYNILRIYKHLINIMNKTGKHFY